MRRLAPGVDETVFHAGAGGAEIRARYGLADRPVVVCVSRLVPRKGQDTLIRSWPRVLRAVPDAALLLVGGGPYRTALERLRDETGVAGSVRITGTVPWEELPAHYDVGDVFAMPCRTRRAGLDVEGLGIVYLEASATGLPVIAGDSGGAPDAVLAGETGVVVDGHSVTAVAQSVIDLLSNPKDAAAMGEKGRSWIEQEWRWEVQARRFATLLRDC
jgi:phosphatidylinositol alpha-1,6-mannosyltransferase